MLFRYADNVDVRDSVLIEIQNKMVSAKVEHTSVETNKGIHDTNFFAKIIIVQYCSRIARLPSLFFSGAFVPLTTEGNILVDGVLASCYASFNHDIQQAVMKPLLWFPNIMDLLLGEGKSMHGYVTILQHLGGMMSPDKVQFM